jgi:hypothetical protein
MDNFVGNLFFVCACVCALIFFFYSFCKDLFVGSREPYAVIGGPQVSYYLQLIARANSFIITHHDWSG